MGEYSNIHPSWENVAVSKIKNMMVTEQGLALDTICHFLEEHSQVGPERLMLPTGRETHGAGRKSRLPPGSFPSHHIELINHLRTPMVLAIPDVPNTLWENHLVRTGWTKAQGVNIEA